MSRIAGSGRGRARAEWCAPFECVCGDVDVHRSRVDGRRRGIPGWYELTWERVERGRRRYEPLREPKVVIDAVESLEHNLAVVMHHLTTARADPQESPATATSTSPTRSRAGDEL